MNNLSRNLIIKIRLYLVAMSKFTKADFIAQSKFTKSEFIAQMGHYFPPEARIFVAKIFTQENFYLEITPPRESKKGDYRHCHPLFGRPFITINDNLPPYEFLLVYLHEVAHHIAYKEHARNIRPHGKEWKAKYRQLFHELFAAVTLPDEVRSAFETHLKHIKSSSILDVTLNALFNKDKAKEPNEVFVKELQPNDLFLCQKKVFRFDCMVRTRARCTMIRNERRYLVAGHAKVVKLIN